MPDRVLAMCDAGFGDAECLEFYRYAALAARLEGDDDSCAAFLLDLAKRASLAGDLLAAVDALRRLEAAGLTADDHWESLFEAVAERGFGEQAVDVARTNLTRPADVSSPPPSVAGLIARLTSAALPEPSTFLPVAILAELPADELRDCLRSSQIRVAPTGKPLRTAVGNAAGWILTGAITTPMGEVQTTPGTAFVPPTSQKGPVASVPTRFISLPDDTWHRLRAGGGAPALASLGRRQRVAGALRRSELFRRLDAKGRTFFLENMRCVTAADSAVIHTGHSVAGLFIVVAGAVAVIDRETQPPQEIARLGVGELFGELDVLTGGGAAFDVVADGPVELCLIESPSARALLRSSPEVRRFLVELTDERRSEVRVLDTGEVTLIDDPTR